MWLRVCPIDCPAHIVFFKTKNCLNDDSFISCNDRIGKMLHDIRISAGAVYFVCVCVCVCVWGGGGGGGAGAGRCNINFWIIGKYVYWLLTFTALWANSADDKFVIFFQKVGLDISCKLSQMETFCMKCQILFSGKNKRTNFKMLSAENTSVKMNTEALRQS